MQNAFALLYLQKHVLDKGSAVAEMGDHLATIDMGRKVGAAVPLFEAAGSPSTQCGLSRGLPPCQVAS